MKEEEDIDILEFLMSSDFNNMQYSSDQYKFFLKKYQKYYKLINAKYHGMKYENERIIVKTQKLEDQLLKSRRSNSIDKAMVINMKKELNKKLSFKERIIGKLFDRFNPDNI